MNFDPKILKALLADANLDIPLTRRNARNTMISNATCLQTLVEQSVIERIQVTASVTFTKRIESQACPRDEEIARQNIGRDNR
jgi:hypothetical protein